MISQWTNHLWQSTLFAVAIALLTLTFRRNRAEVRYWLWLSASIKFLIPFALLMNLGSCLWNALGAKKLAPEFTASSVSLTVQQITQPFPHSSPSTLAPVTHIADWIFVAVFGVWLCGILSVIFVRFRGWLRVRAAVCASTPIDIQAAVVVRSSPGLLEPGVIGFFRPVLLLPEGILERLSPSQLDTVIAHELSHIRRRDNLTAAIHMVVEAIFWFHPLVWWIGARLVEERERACDEAVLSLGGKPRDYVDAIVNVCKLYVESPLACISGITGADLKKRIVRIMTEGLGYRLSFGKQMLLAGLATCTVVGPVAVGLLQARPLIGQVLHASGPLPSFEVATIRVVDAPLPPPSSAPPPMAKDEVRVFGPARNLIVLAYNVKAWGNRGVLGGPSWVDGEDYEVHAKIDPAMTDAMQQLSSKERNQKIELMEQALLAERFKLKVHFETRELPEYELVLTKGGARLSPAANPSGPHNRSTLSPSGQGEELKGTGVTADGLAGMMQGLSEIGGLPIIDRTGLTGIYDLDLNWVENRGVEPVNQNNGPSLFAALEEQLGLKLISTKGPVEVVVVDQIEKPSVDGAEIQPVSPPVLISSVPPEFTEEARKAKISGDVLVGLLVDERGNPTQVRTLRGLGKGLDEKAVEAVKQYKYSPAMQNGKPVQAQITATVKFQVF